MKKTAIMTDTNSGITPEKAKRAGLYLLKMPFIVEGLEYTEYGAMAYDDFFVKLKNGAEASTSQPSPAALTDMWDEILKSHREVLYIPMSSALSGTCETAKMLSAEYDGRVAVADNKRISVTLYASVLQALGMAEKGMSAGAIAAVLEETAAKQSVYVSVNTLEQLKKSGRITAAGAAVGTFLGIKPVLQINGGKLDAYKKVRGINAAVNAMLDGIEADLKEKFAGERVMIRVAFSGDGKAGEDWRKAAAERFPDYEIELDRLPISICCHVGAGAMGIGIAPIL